MLTSDARHEIGVILRSLEQKLVQNPDIMNEGELSALDHIERAILALLMVHIRLRQQTSESDTTP